VAIGVAAVVAIAPIGLAAGYFYRRRRSSEGTTTETDEESAVSAELAAAPNQLVSARV